MKDITRKKDYKLLRYGSFRDLQAVEFLDVYFKYRRLKIQYRILQFANFLERLNVPKFKIPIVKFTFMFLDFLRWKLYDLLIHIINGKVFNLYGVTCYCGRQGGGKTIGIIEELERIRSRFPDCIICTNINYLKQDLPLTSWIQLLELRNGEKGVVFVIDEVQNQGLDWSKFPDTLLRVVTMQRKQKIKIYLTSQVYKNVVIQLRRQCFDVVECRTFLGRWSRQKCYDAEEYNNILDISTIQKRMKLKKKWKHSFIQPNYIRELYDTNQVVSTIKDFEKLFDQETIDKIKLMENVPEKRLSSCWISKAGTR